VITIAICGIGFRIEMEEIKLEIWAKVGDA